MYTLDITGDLFDKKKLGRDHITPMYYVTNFFFSPLLKQ